MIWAFRGGCGLPSELPVSSSSSWLLRSSSVSSAVVADVVSNVARAARPSVTTSTHAWSPVAHALLAVPHRVARVAAKMKMTVLSVGQNVAAEFHVVYAVAKLIKRGGKKRKFNINFIPTFSWPF